VLPQVDAAGRAMPGAFGRDSAGAGATPHLLRHMPAVEL
jgi:hypothetical protein